MANTLEGYRAILEEAIRGRMDDSDHMGTENSGDIDSASITAYLAHFFGEPGDHLWNFGLVTCEQEVMERFGLYNNYMETACYVVPYRRINDFILQRLLPMPYIATRLENYKLMAAAHGDVHLVQQYLSTLNIEKIGPRDVGRYLHRRAGLQFPNGEFCP